MNRFTFPAAVAALALASGAASAQTGQMVVSVADLNLTTPQGAAIALQRIDSAAVKFCGGEPERDIGRFLQQQQCKARMTDKAVTQLDSIRVTALRDGKPSLITVASRSR